MGHQQRMNRWRQCHDKIWRPNVVLVLVLAASQISYEVVVSFVGEMTD
jgi:hypothetical protein